jgi:ribosomal protein S18 acetylase RimI-like enzyme
MVEVTIAPADTGDAENLLALQKAAYQSEAHLYQDWSIPPLTQTLSALVEEFSVAVVLKAICADLIVGSVRATIAAGVCHIGRLIVHPDFQRNGIGTRFLSAIEAQFPAAAKYELFTGSLSDANIRLYQRHGYAVQREQALSPTVTLVFMEKEARPGIWA